MSETQEAFARLDRMKDEHLQMFAVLVAMRAVLRNGHPRVLGFEATLDLVLDLVETGLEGVMPDAGASKATFGGS